MILYELLLKIHRFKKTAAWRYGAASPYTRSIRVSTVIAASVTSIAATICPVTLPLQSRRLRRENSKRDIFTGQVFDYPDPDIR